MCSLRPHPGASCVLFVLALLLAPAVAHAQEPTPAAADQTAPNTASPGEDATQPAYPTANPPAKPKKERNVAADDAHDRTIRTVTRPGPRERDGASRVTREELDIRQPRSTPDALRYEAGVFVQQTAHSQGSAFVRGRTGQQTVLLFDGVRMNNSLFRQGPNQYFFTIDSRTIQSIDVIRGAASTRYGSDAIAGVLHALPVEPRFLKNPEGFRLAPRLMLRHATADGELGGRAQIEGQFGEDWAFLSGVGYRKVGQLESGGPIYNPQDGELPEVPRFAEDGRTQLGTGFKELTLDTRAVGFLSKTQRVTLAYYDYRQYDAPRTDQCPPAYAPFDECLKYEEQFRTLLYTNLASRWRMALLDRSSITLSFQRQHERRSAVRPSSFIDQGGRDDVNTFGMAARAQTKYWAAESLPVAGRVRYGLDLYHDRVSSAAWITFTDLEITRLRSRGQYIEGSRYTWGGAFTELNVFLGGLAVVRAGGRGSIISAAAPEDVESGTLPVDRAWTPLVGNLNLELYPGQHLALFANLDQGFRAPNLDDMTSRQRTGPGYQIENAALDPERGITQELGLRLRTKFIELDAWTFRSTLRNTIARAPREADDCPPNNSTCRNAWSRLQLVNVPGEARILGAEGGLKLKLPQGVQLATTIAYAWGDSPNPQERPTDPSLAYQERVPLSRIPPLNGTFEALWRVQQVRGLYFGAGLRWARTQDRLALSDQSDARIPLGGTPGFATLDLRAGWRFKRRALLAIVFENVTDEAYRYHGSSVNGPGRGLIANLEVGM